MDLEAVAITGARGVSGKRSGGSTGKGAFYKLDQTKGGLRRSDLRKYSAGLRDLLEL